MPCFQRRQETVEFAPQNHGVLLTAVKSLNGKLMRNGNLATVVLPGSVTITLEGGLATGPKNQVTQLVKAYSQAVLQHTKIHVAQKGYQCQTISENHIKVRL